MSDSINSANEWDITANIGPISFNILLDSAFFNYSTHQNSERHRHAIFELHIITKGSGIMYIDDVQYEVVPESFYIVKEGVCHMQKGSVSNPIQRYTLKFEFEICNNTSNSYPEEEIKSFIYILSNIRFFYSKNLNRIKNLITEIQTELEQKSFGYYSKTQHLFSLLFLGIIREIAVERKQASGAASIKINQENRIRIIENFFDTNYNTKVTSGDLCRLLHISRSQLNRIIKDKYKIPFKQKHIETQIEFAKDLLVNTNLPISVIAEKSGYTSESNFSAFFKHKLGVSPKSFREQGKVP